MSSHSLENHLGKYLYTLSTHANILTKKLINQFENQIAYEQEIHTFNVKTMNMAFNAFTM